jgi:hypothetical protein
MRAIRIEREEWDRLRAKGIMDEADSLGASDWQMIYPKGNDEKYSSMMYSKKLDRIRRRTMAEFYSGGIID